MDLEKLNEIAGELEGFIVGSNGVEVYRITSKARLHLPPDLMAAFHSKYHSSLEILFDQFIVEVYLHLAQQLMKKYSWIEGLNGVGPKEGLDLRTDYPVLDVKNKLVPDPEEARKRLADLKEIQKLVDGSFRDVKKHMGQPNWIRRMFRSAGMGAYDPQ